MQLKLTRLTLKTIIINETFSGKEKVKKSVPSKLTIPNICDKFHQQQMGSREIEMLNF